MQILPFAAFLIVTLEYFFFINFVWVAGNLQTCCRHYCPSLIIVLQLSVFPWPLTAETPSNDHKNRKRHQCKDAVTCTLWRNRKKRYLRFLRQIISLTTLSGTVLQLWITLYIEDSKISPFVQATHQPHRWAVGWVVAPVNEWVWVS